MVAGPISEPTIGRQIYCRRQNFHASAWDLARMLREMAEFIETNDETETDPQSVWGIDVHPQDDEGENWDGAVYIGGIRHPKVVRTLYYPEDLP